MIKNNKAFVLLETIVVITVLGTILIMLYSSFSTLTINVHKKDLFDNTEYIYKTEVIREYLENIPEVVNTLGSKYVNIYCSEFIGDIKCNDTDLDGNKLFNFLKVKAIYFTIWNIDPLNNEVLVLEPTTQNYIKSLNAEDKGVAYRIIVMFQSENDEDRKSTRLNSSHR